MKYMLVRVEEEIYTEAARKLESKVNELCEKGWRPQGGASVSIFEVGYSHYACMVQAMVKDDDKPKQVNDGRVGLLD